MRKLALSDEEIKVTIEALEIWLRDCPVLHSPRATHARSALKALRLAEPVGGAKRRPRGRA